MADKNKDKSISDVGSFFSRIQGQDRIRKSDSLIVLNTPENERERKVKQKISSIVQYVRNKTWSRRHVEFFEEYRRMTATFPIIKAGVDIYAEELCAKNSDGNIFTVKCDNKKVKELLEQCYFKNLALNAKAYRIAREMCKFGNAFAYVITRPKDGVTDLVFLPPEAVIREQMYDPTNLENYRFTWYGGGGGAVFEPWEIVHWKNGEDIEMEPYGTSILRSIVDTWRRVVLIREALVIYRITRAPSRLLFKVGTDGLTGEEAFRFAQDMKKEVTKKPLVNPTTGEIDFKYNPLSIEENIFMPVFEGSPSDVSVLDGAGNLDAVEDYKIIKDDLFAGLKIPKSYLSFEEDLSNKAALAEEDIRFAKTIQRLQSEFVEGLLHVGVVHLFLQGCSQEEMESFTIEMNNPSIASEKKKLELVQARLEIAKSAWDYNNPGLNLMSYIDVLKTILKFTDSEIEQTIKSQFNEKKISWRLQKLREDGAYSEPDVEQKIAELRGLTGNADGKLPTGFDGMSFESSTLTEVMKRKIDEEIREIVQPVSAKPTTKMVRQLTEGKDLSKNLKKSRKDFGM
jgi:hypothetical protein